MEIMQRLFEPLSFLSGRPMKNRFMLAPLTNSQSHDDGRLSDEEFHWLVMRAKGGFGTTMTCAAHVQAQGRGFPGQLGIFSDDHLEGLTRLAEAIGRHDSLSSVQLHHAGMRSPAALIGTAPQCPSANEEFGARALSTWEVEQVIEDFVLAALRAEQAGFDGVELHGAHGYLLCQFLSSEINHRTDRFGGSLDNRTRPLFDIVDGIRSRCRADFQIGVRLSPERFGLDLKEVRQIAQRLMRESAIDYLDMSLWDVFKEPADEAYRGRSLMSYFTELDRGSVRLGVAGKVARPADAMACLDAGADFVLLGRAAILNHDFPHRTAADPEFQPATVPVPREHLRNEGLGESFIGYMSSWPGFVDEVPALKV
jgi:2,4-dienoyl-CoA reductase-like NADH-dependent reductase (Old Yellow Enzyme family)